jgi:phenylpyruvate tautomerase PptA (4-oxalocrotonate tautomerase family)
MPLVRIEVVGTRSPSERKGLFEAIHAALVEAFGIPEDDRTQRLIEHEPGAFEVPPGDSDRYTLVEITAFAGRSTTAKRALYQAIVRNLGEVRIPPEDVSIVLHEEELENWGIRGGRSADEVDLGFDVNV